MNDVFLACFLACSDHIEPHDDRAYTNVRMDTGEIVECSRCIACIYYLSKDWRRDYGGLLVDCESGTEYVPEFNSVVLFRIPRMHEVTPVTITSQKRLSIFGWFLRPGRLYDLQLSEPTASEEPDVNVSRYRAQRKKQKTGDLCHYQGSRKKSEEGPIRKTLLTTKLLIESKQNNKESIEYRNKKCCISEDCFPVAVRRRSIDLSQSIKDLSPTVKKTTNRKHQISAQKCKLAKRLIAKYTRTNL